MSKKTGHLVTKEFNGKQTSSLVSFCRHYENKFGTSFLRKIRVTVIGFDNETGEANKRIQGSIRGFTDKGYIRNIAIEEDKTGIHYVVACDTAKFERIAAKSIILQYFWEGDVRQILKRVSSTRTSLELTRLLKELEIGLPSDIDRPQIRDIIKRIHPLLKRRKQVREQIATIARQLKSPQVFSLLVDLWNDDDPVVRRYAVMDAESLPLFLNEKQTSKLHETLVSLTKDPDEGVRIYAAEALGFLGSAKDLQVLQAREHDTPEVQWATIGAIATIFPNLSKNDIASAPVDIDSLLSFFSEVLYNRSMDKAIRNTAALGLGQFMLMNIEKELKLDKQMSYAFQSLMGKVSTHGVRPEIQIAVAKQLIEVLNKWQTKRIEEMPPWVTPSNLFGFLQHLESLLSNPWDGQYCPIMDKLCTTSVETKNHCFIIFKYGENGDEWCEVVSSVVDGLGINPIISRELSNGTSKGSHCTLICEPIRSSIMCIADISKDCTNVGFEIQLAWKYNKPLILTFHEDSVTGRNQPPFDLQGLLYVCYDDHEQLKERLENKIIEVKRKINRQYVE